MIYNVINTYSDSYSSTIWINIFDNYSPYMLKPEEVVKYHLLCCYFRNSQVRSLYP